MEIAPTASLPQSPFSTQFANTLAAARCCSPLFTQRLATPPHPSNSLAARHPHPPNPIRTLIAVRSLCPRHWGQEPSPGAGPRHHGRLEMGAPIMSAMVPPVDLGYRCSSASLPASMHQSRPTTQAAAATNTGCGGPPPRCLCPAFMELQPLSATFWKTSQSCGCRRSPWPAAALRLLCPGVIGYIPSMQLLGPIY